jgi:urease accessory protein UreF
MDERWERVRQIVREECERIERRLQEKIVEAAQQNRKSKLEFVNGKWVGVTEQQLEAWREAFPAADIEAELRKMAAWIVSNPASAPKSQLGRFVNAWLTKCQNQASLRLIPTGRADPKSIAPSLCEYCLKPAMASVNGIRHCREHGNDAMDMKPRPKMPGITAKAVAGND